MHEMWKSLAALRDEVQDCRREQASVKPQGIPPLPIGSDGSLRMPPLRPSKSMLLPRDASLQHGAPAEAADIRRLYCEFQDLRDRVASSFARLDAALDAARMGIARVAKELHLEREARKGAGVVPRLAAPHKQGELREALQLPLCKAATPHLEGDIPTTVSALAQVGVLRDFGEPTSGKAGLEAMLARPTFRFVHRVVMAVRQRTGFPRSIAEDWPLMEEAKLAFVGKVWGAIVEALRIDDVEFCAADVLRCTRRDRTRRFLRLLASAAKQEGDRDDAPAAWLRPPSRARDRNEGGL